MEAEQIFATGGVSGITGIVLYMLYKILTGKWKIKSGCCGKEISIETNASEHDLQNVVVENPIHK